MQSSSETQNGTNCIGVLRRQETFTFINRAKVQANVITSELSIDIKHYIKVVWTFTRNVIEVTPFSPSFPTRIQRAFQLLKKTRSTSISEMK